MDSLPLLLIQEPTVAAFHFTLLDLSTNSFLGCFSGHVLVFNTILSSFSPHPLMVPSVFMSILSVFPLCSASSCKKLGIFFLLLLLIL